MGESDMQAMPCEEGRGMSYCKTCEREHIPASEDFHIVLHPSQEFMKLYCEENRIGYLISQMVHP